MLKVLRARVLLLGSQARALGPIGHVGGMVRFVDDLGTAGGVTLCHRVLEGERGLGPLFLHVGEVRSILTRWLPLNQSRGLRWSLLVQVLAVLLSETSRGVLVLHITSAARLLVEALRDRGQLHQAGVGGQALVFDIVVEVRDGLLRLVELVVELADVLWLDELALAATSVAELGRTLVARSCLQA